MPEVGTMARPAVPGRRRDAGDVERVSMDVSNGGEQLAIVGDRNRVESASEEWSVASNPVVHVSRVDRPQVLHEGGQPGLGTVEQQVVVVREQAIGMDFDAEAFVAHPEQTAVLDAVGVAEERVTAGDPSVHDVRPAVFDVDSRCSSHTDDRDDGL
jgi:hypothetical protein